MVVSNAPEKIVSGSSEARRSLGDLLDEASKGTTVTIVAGDRIVTMISRALYLAITQRLRIAEEMAEILADADTITALQQFKSAMESGKLEGVSPTDAAKLLGLED